MVEGDNLCAALVAILLLDFQQVVLHDLLATLRVVENLLQVGNQLHQVVILLVQLLDAQTCKLRQTHIDNSLRLQLVQLEAGFQVTLSIGRCLRVTYDAHHLVNIVHGNDQAFQYVSTFLSFAQVVLRAADGHLMAVFNEVLHTILEVQQPRTALHQRNVID